jgi:class 3 adenylate cyclase
MLQPAKFPMRDLGAWKPPGCPIVHVYEARPPDELEAAGSSSRWFLSALLFTDVVQSTATAAGLGAGRWRVVVEQHHAIIREELDRHHGTEIDTAGDGFYASFDGVSKAIDCALAIRDRVRPLGIDIRAGIHAGDCEIIAGKIAGLTVVIGARIHDLAGTGEVFVSQTVTDLVIGGGFTFEDRGRHMLKGVPGEWRILSVGRGT